MRTKKNSFLTKGIVITIAVIMGMVMFNYGIGTKIAFAHHAKMKAKRPTSQFLAVGKAINFTQENMKNYEQKATAIMKEEAIATWKLYAGEVIRQIYIVDATDHRDEPGSEGNSHIGEDKSSNGQDNAHYQVHKDDFAVIIILECKDIEEAREIVNNLPFVKAGLIEFDMYSLMPYLLFPLVPSEPSEKPATQSEKK